MSDLQKTISTLRKPSPSQMDVADFNIPIRSKLYPGEDSFFKSNKHVAGMAAEDNKVILNPYSTLTDDEKRAVANNEAARIYMRTGKDRPSFSITEKQRKSFAGTAYGSNDQALRETIAARIYSGDPSAGDATPEQKSYVESILRGKLK